MRTSGSSLKAAVLLAAVASTAVVVGAEEKQSVAFPEGYRSWQHVKSILVGPDHITFARRGGLHHYYANELAVRGYETGEFPNGAVIVDEGVFAQDGEGFAKGILREGERRSVEVMVKDEVLYKDTGGWGFERFEGEDKTGKLTASDQAACHACHLNAKDRDLVFSRIRL